MGQAPEREASRGHTPDQRRLQKPRLPSPGPRLPGLGRAAMLGLWAQERRPARATGNRPALARTAPSAPSLPPRLPQWPGAPVPRAHGVKSLPVSLCSKLFSKRGREWFSCYQHGFWALGNVLALLPAPLHKGTFCSSPGPSPALPRPPTHRDPPSPRLPPHAAPLGGEE